MQHDEGQEVNGLVAEDGQLALLNRSEIEQQIATARRFPRSVKKFRDEAFTMVTLSETVAQQCIYALPRDKKVIEGPSARFAEVIMSAWGNCRAAARVVDDKGDFVTAQGAFHDLERNVAITYEVQRRITDKQGRRYGADMIGVTANAASSIAMRNAILKGIPKAFWEDMYIAARQVIMGDIKTLINRRHDAIEAFKKFGVTQEQILAKLELKGMDDVGLEQIVVLRGMLTAIRDGDSTAEEMFHSRPGLAAAAKNTVNTPERDALMVKLKQAGEDGGLEAIAALWADMSEDDRGLVGIGIDEIKNGVK